MVLSHRNHAMGGISARQLGEAAKVFSVSTRHAIIDID